MHLEKTMDKITTVTLLLPPDEAKKWLMFQQYYDTFGLLVDKGVFTIRNGSATLNFDPQGELKSISRNDILWRQ